MDLGNLAGNSRDMFLLAPGLDAGSLKDAGSDSVAFANLPGLLLRTRETLEIFSSMDRDALKEQAEWDHGLAFLRILFTAAAQQAAGTSGNRARDLDRFERTLDRAFSIKGLRVRPRAQSGGADLVLEQDQRGQRLSVMMICCDRGENLGDGSLSEREILMRKRYAAAGWQCETLWSVDWYANPQGEAERLLSKELSKGSRITAMSKKHA